MIDLNDEAVGAVRGVRLEGLVRLGMQEDFGESVLTGILGRFRRAHPKVRIQALIARNAELVHRVPVGRPRSRAGLELWRRPVHYAASG